MASYTPFNNNFYMQELQSMRDRIDNQMRQYQQNQYMQQPVQQPITQNFQLAANPTNNELESKYAESIDEVRNTFVVKTGLFINKNFTTLWIKDVTGKIKTYNIEEVIELDEKDKKILMLEKQLNELRGEISNANTSDSTELSSTIASKKSARVSNGKSND